MNPDEGFIPRFMETAAREPDRIFARMEQGDTLTFADLATRSGQIARRLLDAGLQPGDRVVLMLRNDPDTIALIFALARAGLVWVPVNVQFLGTGLAHILTHSAPSAILAETDCLTALADCGASLPVLMIARGDASWEALFATGAPALLPAPPPGHALFALSYTSGTTGLPKGVQVTHHMFRVAGEGAARVADVHDDDVLFVWEPFYHIGGSQLLVLPSLARVSLHLVARFSASRFWAQAAAAGATHIHYLGGILQLLLRQPPGPAEHAHRVRIAWGGGCPPNIWATVQDRFNLRIRECYGMTETSSFVTCNADGVTGSVGRPLPWMSVSIRDARGRPVPCGERGEIVAASTDAGALTPGYFRNPEATANALRDGMLHTGDLGSLDQDGFLWFHGRLSDNVRVRGENVSAWEVEHVVNGHPLVKECALVGVAAEIGEQDIKIFVQVRENQTLDPAALAAWLQTRLPRFQRPRYIAFVEDFERTPSQRIMKHRLSKETGGCWDRQQMESSG
ncbi:MAG: AMP-binding protein [Gluconacetobacter liquefaciens]